MLEDVFKKYFANARIIGDDILDVTNMINFKFPTSFWNQVVENVFKSFINSLPEQPEFVLTAKTSGPIISTALAYHLSLDMIAASKTLPITFKGEDCYEKEILSKTSGEKTVLYLPKKFFLNESTGKKYYSGIIADDFLAGGNVSNALLDFCEDEGIKVSGAVFAFVKSFDKGLTSLKKRGLEVLGAFDITNIWNDGKNGYAKLTSPLFENHQKTITCKLAYQKRI